MSNGKINPGQAVPLEVDVVNAFIPVTISGPIAIDQTTPGTTNGVVVNSSALPTGAAIAANQQTDALTDTQLRATPVPVSIGGTIAVTQSTSPWVISGTVAFSNTTIAVTNTGTFAVQVSNFPASQIVNFNGIAQPVTFSGGIAIDQTTPGTTNGVVVNSSALPTGAATAANQQTDALTDAELRATPVPVTDANIADHDDIFGRPTTTSPNNDIDIQFFRAAPSSLLTVTTANSATATSNVGGALFASSTNTNGSVQGVTTETTSYKSGFEVYAMFTASFTAGIASSYMRIGLYDGNDGFFIGYEGTTFGVTIRNNASDTTVAKASFSEDDLTGSATSRFTRDGTPEAINLTKLNVFRIRFGWLGSAPCFWEVMSPDGHWVTFHKTLFPNLQTTPSIRSADLPITLDITKTGAAATDLQIQTDCWGAGTSSGTQEAQSDKIAFSTTTVLAGGATYSSGILALSPKYSQVQTQVLASKAGTINIYWYSDAAGSDLVRTLTIPYGASDGFQMFSAPAFTPYVKYDFVNAPGAAQTDFYFDTKFLRRPLSPQILRVDGTIVGGMVSTLNRSVIAGESSGGGGGYVNVKVNPSGTLETNATVSGTVTANLGAGSNIIGQVGIDQTTPGTTNGVWINNTNLRVTNSPGAIFDNNIVAVNGVVVNLGQTTMAGSFPVTLASDQSTLPVSISGTVFVSQSTSPWVVSGTVSISGPVTVTGSLTTINTVTNLAQMAGAAISMNAGAADTGTQRVAVAAPTVLFRGRSSTFRTPGRAGTTGQNLMAIHNATGSAVTVKVSKVNIDMYQTVVKAITVAPPIVRLWKVTALPTNGTALAKTKIGGTTTSSASVTVFGDASADGTGSGTTLTTTLPGGTFVAQKMAARIITAVGEVGVTSMEFDIDKEVELGALEGIVVFLDYTLATQNPTTDMWVSYLQWEEI